MDYSHVDEGSEAQNIIRQAEAPPDSPFRPRFRRRSGEIAIPAGFPTGAAGTMGPPTTGGAGSGGTGSSKSDVQRIKLGVLLGKRPVADALSRFLTLRDVFKMGASCRQLMRMLLTVGRGAEGGAGAAGVPQQQQGVAAAVGVVNGSNGGGAAAVAGAGGAAAAGVVAAAAVG
ncbi:unnamed protein product, partial [Ectocarpus sp. 12 AP-2014]